jgi:organic radical activating enzyme
MQYPVMELFYTIQGEGAYSGTAAYFIRLAGCDVGCVWCDVKESWDASKHKILKIDAIIDNIPNHCQRVVITGGEPAMYDLVPLVEALKSNQKIVHIETSGAYLINANIDWICVSPKKFKAPLVENIAKADELKIVIFNKHDFDWAEKNALSANETCKLYLQPEWSVAEKVTPLIVDYVMQNTKWNISLQTHKYLQIP